MVPEWESPNGFCAATTRPSWRGQDFPISIELQLLGGLGDGRSRTTANMCSPGTDVDIGPAAVRAHCVNSRSETYHGDQWVRVEAIVLGDSLITHIVNGDTVLTYSRPRIGGGNVSGHDPAVKVDGTPLTRGYIALQSEGHPVEFRKVEIRSLTRETGAVRHDRRVVSGRRTRSSER
jgi:hypothetical protein